MHQPWLPCPGAAFVGIDGARGGWVVATLSKGKLSLAMSRTISEVPIPTHSRVLIDMPIGLPTDSRRSCDAQARALLGQRRATIFPVPAREAVYAASYSECCESNLKHQHCKVSKQAWNLFPKMRELDCYMRDNPLKHAYIAEGHPELAFRALSNSHEPVPSKRTADGLRMRRDLLMASGFCFDSAVSTFLQSHTRSVDITDAYDALALCALLAQSQGEVSFVTDGAVDDYGAPQRICVG